MDDLKAIDESDPLLGQIATEYFERLSRGESPKIAEYVERYPDIASDIQNVLPALQRVNVSFAGSSKVDEPDGGMVGNEFGDFRVLRELGRGGMGVVYEAEQLSMGGRQVALKVMPFAGLSDQARMRRFHNEVRAAASLDHPNIVAVYSAGDVRGVHYYAMQLVRGMSVASLIDQLRSWNRDFVLEGDSIERLVVADFASTEPPREDIRTEEFETGNRKKFESRISASNASHDKDTVDDLQGFLSTSGTNQKSEYFRSIAALGVQAAEALHHAHARGVIHRDIKPANLILDVEAKLYVTDFGLALIEEDVGVTMTGDLVGTLRYMSPEQVLGRRVAIDHRTDIYSLGISLFELVTTQYAFNGDSRATLIEQIAFREPRHIRALNPAVPRDLETIIHKAIAKDPVERYSTAQELADDLRNFCASKPISAKPPNLIDMARKWVFRNQGIATTLILACVLTVIGLTISNALIAQQRNAALEAGKSERIQREIAQQATAEAEKQKGLAEENFRAARKAVDTYLAKVAKEALLDNPGLATLRRELLESAQEFYSQFTASHSRDRFLKQDLAESHWHLGEICSLLGEVEPAREAHQEALEICLALSDESDATDEDFLQLSRSYERVAQLVDRETAKHLLAKAFEEVSRLSPEFADSIAARTHLAGLNLSMSTLDEVEGRDKIALEYIAKATNVYEQLVVDSPDEPMLRSQLAEAYNRSHRIHSSGTPADKAIALTEIRKSIATHRKLAEEFPASHRYQERLAGNYNNCGLLFQWMDRPEESVTVLKQAIEINTHLSSSNPQVVVYAEDLIGNYINLSESYILVKDLEAAEQVNEEAISLVNQLTIELSDSTKYRSWLSMAYERSADILQKQGDYSEEVRVLRETLEILDELRLADPQKHTYRHRSVQLRVALADAYESVGDPVSAHQASVDAVRLLLTFPRDEWGPAFHWFHARAQLHLEGWSEMLGSTESYIKAYIEGGGDDLPNIQKTIWWYKAIALHHTGQEHEARQLFDTLSAQLSQAADPKPDWLDYRKQAANLLGLGSTAVPNENVKLNEVDNFAPDET